MNIIEKLFDPRLYGGLPCFKDMTTWANWVVFLKVFHGLPLANDVELAAFKQFTGRSRYTPPPGGFPEACVITGVQSGKSTIAGLELADGALEGEAGTMAMGVSQDFKGSTRVLLKYARAPFETLPLFQAEVSRDTMDTMELTRGTSLTSGPCRPTHWRGVKASKVVLDEPAFYISTDGRPTDLEMWRVARGRVAMTHGKILAISSPYGQTGLLWDLHNKHYGQDDSPTLIWQASAPDMNPLLSHDYLSRLEIDDPEAYRSEVLGEFRTGLTSLFDPEMIDACVDQDVRERSPQDVGIGRTKGFFDGSGERVDPAVAAVAKTGPNGRALLCAIRVWPSPHNPSGVIAESARSFEVGACLTPTATPTAPNIRRSNFGSTA